MKALLIASVALVPLAACDKPTGDAGANVAAPTVTTPGLPAATPVPAAAVPAGPSLGQSMDAKEELKLDVIEATRAGGVLTVRTRITLVAGKSGSRPVPGSVTDGIYVSAADKKYLTLKDDAGKAIASNNFYPTFDGMGSTATWWAKFPAPPPEVKAVNFYFNDFAPVENVAITDR